MVNRLAPFMLLISLIGGCAPVGAQEQAATRANVTTEQLFAVALRPIADNWLKPVSLPQLVTDGLRRVARTDGTLWVLEDQGHLLLMRDGKERARLPLPEDGMPERWANLTAGMLQAMLAASPTLAAKEREALYRDMFDGMMADLDPYSRYTDPGRADQERSQREGYDGIGIAIRETGGFFEVADLVPDGPAALAGIRAGERILAVGGVQTAGMAYATLAGLIQGPDGSPVELRLGATDAQTRNVIVRRRHLVPNTVQSKLEDGILTLRIDRFNNATQENVRNAILRAQGQAGRLKGAVLDLRGNPGGVMVQAVGVVNLFVPQGRIITTRGRHPNSVQWFEAQKPVSAFADLPLAVLIDGQTASSAEIVAAALQDAGRALVIGSSSFGKGSVQLVNQLPNGGELFITWSRIYAPSGYSFDVQGVQPNICITRPGATRESLLALAGRSDGGEQARLMSQRMTASDDPQALASLRAACPPALAEDGRTEPKLTAADIAGALLADAGLYRQALASRHINVAER